MRLLAMKNQLKTFQKTSGELYRLQPLPFPKACFDQSGNRLPATYANFLICNGAVLVPVYGVPQDTEALEVIQRLFPNRETIGINCLPLIQQGGSLHCITMQYPESVRLTI